VERFDRDEGSVRRRKFAELAYGLVAAVCPTSCGGGLGQTDLCDMLQQA
jgi:hypothetical protein